MSMIGIFIPLSAQELEKYVTDSTLFDLMLDAALDEERNPDWLDIHKWWDALSWTIFGAHVLDPDQDLGYGPANYLTPPEVKELAAALSGISIPQLKANYDSAKMNELELYPNNWDDEDINFLLPYFEQLKKFYAKAAANNQAVITYLS
jgi:hypothetical protein